MFLCRDIHIIKIHWKNLLEGHPAMQLSTTLTQPPPQWEKNQEGKRGKTHGLRWRLLGKQSGGKKPTKAQCTKQSITISWPICSQSSSNGNSYKTPPSSFIYDHDVMWYLPLVNLGQLSQLCTLPASYLLPTHLLMGREGETETALTLCTRCLVITKPLVR